MRKTYAYNSVIIGVLVGMLFVVKGNVALGIILGIVITVGGFLLIRAIENALYKGADAAGQAVVNAINKKKEQKLANNNLCPKCGAQITNEDAFCENCGEKLK